MKFTGQKRGIKGGWTYAYRKYIHFQPNTHTHTHTHTHTPAMALAHRREITSVFKGQAKGNRGLSAVSYDLINTQDRKESEEKRWRQDRVTHTHKCTVLLWKRAKEWAGLDGIYCFIWVSDKPWRQREKREGGQERWMDGQREGGMEGRRAFVLV